MKLLIFPFLYLMLFTSNKAYGQLEDYIVDVPGTTALEVFENYLIFPLFKDGRNFIVMSDLNLNDGTYSIITEISGPLGGIDVQDHFLLYTLPNTGKIFKLDLLNLDEEPELLYDNLTPIGEIEAIDNFLFVVEEIEGIISPFDGDQRIIMIDLASVGDTPRIIADSLNVGDLICYNDILIYSEFKNNNCMYTVDFSSDPFELLQLDCVSGAPNGLARRNNELYVSEAHGLTGGVITRRRLDVESDSVSIVVQNLQWPTGAAIYDNYIYIAELSKGTISRLKLEEVSSTSNLVKLAEINIYPNPSSDYIKIDEKEDLFFRMYSVDGVNVMEGLINSNAQICIKQLPSGFYFLHIADGSRAKFQVLK